MMARRKDGVIALTLTDRWDSLRHTLVLLSGAQAEALPQVVMYRNLSLTAAPNPNCSAGGNEVAAVVPSWN